MAQYDPTAVKAGVPTALGADALRADLTALGGATTAGLAAGDAVQVSTALTFVKAVNTATAAVVGVYDGVTGSVVRDGAVGASYAGSAPAAGDTLYLSSTAGKLTATKPTKDMLHEVGVALAAGSGGVVKTLLTHKPVVALPPSPVLSNFLGGSSPDATDTIRQISSPAGTNLGSLRIGGGVASAFCYDGNAMWVTNATTTVYKFDPVSYAVLGGPYTVGDLSGRNPCPHTMAFDGTRYWKIGANGSRVWRFEADGSGAVSVGGTWSTYGMVYDGRGYLWVLDRGFGNRNVYKINCATAAVAATYTPPPGIGTAGTCGAYGTVLGGYFYFICGNKGFPYYLPWDLYLCRIDVVTGAVTASNWLGYRRFGGSCVTDGTHVYYGDDGSTLYKNDVSAWPTVTQVWGVGGSSVNLDNMEYDGQYIWSAYSSSTNFWRISTADGSRVNKGYNYWSASFASTCGALPMFNP